MAFQAAQLLAAGQFPQAYCVVPGAGGEAAAVRRKGDGSYSIRMSFQAAQLLAAGQVPQTDRLSQEPEARLRPSGAKAIDSTLFACPSRRRSS